DTTIALNKSIELDANGTDCESNYEDYTYLWSTGETTETITINGEDLGMGGPFEISVTVTNNSTTSNCITTDAIMINISEADAIHTFENSNIRIFPNPSKGIIKLEFDDLQKNARIELFNIIGKKIYTENFRNISGQKELDFSEFKNGVYFIKLHLEKEILKKKIILY
ncbi:MAG: T9SS type A sorting domain-containing protein, partial [Bacteroidota bacterium]|nr:T9SS type A sorting domain-containing protein [Bacteroidota bacterium]